MPEGPITEAAIYSLHDFLESPERVILGSRLVKLQAKSRGDFSCEPAIRRRCVRRIDGDHSARIGLDEPGDDQDQVGDLVPVDRGKLEGLFQSAAEIYVGRRVLHAF